MEDSRTQQTVTMRERHRARDATRTSRQGARRESRPLLAVGAVLMTLVVLLGSPLRLFSLLGDIGTADGDERDHRTTSASDGPIRDTTASVAPYVTDVGVDGPDARSASTVPTGEVTGRRWGAVPERPEGLELLLEEYRGGWRVEGGNEEAAALAVIAAHAWADVRRRPSGTSPGGTDGRARGTIVAVEAVERPGAHHAVVTMLIAPDGASGPLERIAIPIAMDRHGPSLAGSPWSLPAPAPAVTPVLGMPIDDPELMASARRALDAVGLPGGQLVALEATDGWPFIARLDGTEAHPWLRWHLDRFVIAGLPLARTEDTRP